MRVRQNVVPAAIGAGFLLYFGFLHLAEPTGTDLFNRANWVFYHTLRLGGLAMAAVALWSMLGQGITLAVDAVITVVIGGLLILTGLAMAIDGGDMLQTIINVVCGGMFVSSGRHNWKDYRFLSAAAASSTEVYGDPRTLDVDRASQVPISGATTSLAGNLRRRTLGSAGLDATPEAGPHTSAKHVQPPSPTHGNGRGEGEGQREPAPPPTSPEGFLAALAKKTPPPDADDEGSHT